MQSGYNAFCAEWRPRPHCCAFLPYYNMPAPARRAGHDRPPRAKSSTRSGRIFLSGKEEDAGILSYFKDDDAVRRENPPASGALYPDCIDYSIAPEIASCVALL